LAGCSEFAFHARRTGDGENGERRRGVMGSGSLRNPYLSASVNPRQQRKPHGAMDDACTLSLSLPIQAVEHSAHMHGLTHFALSVCVYLGAMTPFPFRCPFIFTRLLFRRIIFLQTKLDNKK
jgi:hypothetical protein